MFYLKFNLKMGFKNTVAVVHSFCSERQTNPITHTIAVVMVAVHYELLDFSNPQVEKKK